METIEPLVEYFEVKANKIVYKYSSPQLLPELSMSSKMESFNTKLQKMERELDAEINGILSICHHTNMQSLVNDLFFYREKAKLEFTQLNRP